MEKKKTNPPSKKHARRKRRVRILIFEIILLTFLLVGLYGWTKFGMITHETIREEEVKTNDIAVEAQETLSGYWNIALFGVDNRSNGDFDTGHSDTIMICSVNNDTKEVRLVSVYRDTLLEVEEDSLQKATNAYQYGGAKAAIGMLNTNLDLDIKDYVSVDFKALTDAIDAVGGIEIELTDEEADIMNTNYITEVAYVTKKAANFVSGGYQTLDGVQATAYCRVRYTAGNDFKRAERQRTVVSKLVEKAKQASLIEINDLINAVFPNIQTSLSSTQLISLARQYKDYELVDTVGFPFEKITDNVGSKGSVVIPTTLESNVEELYEYLFADEEHEMSEKVKSLSEEIVNLTGYDEDDGVDYGF
ncbi:MAG: LCP family protein [Lachnospiraceae bacterium]|nr:LCP family protein [Lachnospiraceae bacterium]